MRLTQSSCMTLSGVWPLVRAVTKATTSATALMVSWNTRNLRMLLKTERPHSTDLTMEEKLSSRITMSAASLATSVPVWTRQGRVVWGGGGLMVQDHQGQGEGEGGREGGGWVQGKQARAGHNWVGEGRHLVRQRQMGAGRERSGAAGKGGAG